MAEGGSNSGRLTDSFIASSDVVYDLFCEVCADFDKHLEATGFCVECQDYLCDDCITAHGKQRASRNHVVQTKSQMPHQKPSRPVAKPSPVSCTEKCDTHTDRPLEYYCRVDGHLACFVCLVKHKHCRSVDHISDISEHLLDSQDYQQFSTSLANLQTKAHGVINNANDNTARVGNLCTDVSTALQELRGKVMKAFDELEQNMKKHAIKIKSADSKKMKEIADKGTSVLDEVKQITTDLQPLQSKKQLGQLFVRMIKLEDRVQALHRLLDETEADNSVTEFTFEPDSRFQEILDDPTTIGKLSVPTSVIAKSWGVTTEHVNDINVRARGDEKRCWITGSVLLPGNKLVLADYNNSKIKLVNLQTPKVTSVLKMSSAPCDISIISGDQVAVALSNTIAIVTSTPSLTLNREIARYGKCSGVLHNDGKLIVAFSDPPKIEITHMDGKVQRKIDCSKMFKCPSHMSPSPRHDAIYVADATDNCVKRLSLSGNVDVVYKDGQLSSPGDVIVDPHDGRVMVCGRSTGNIHLLSPDLAKIKVLVNGIGFPCSLSLCHSTGKLYVCSFDEISVHHLLS